MRVLFDTAALYVAAGISEAAFSHKVQHLVEAPDTIRLVSPISFVEIALKANKGLTRLTHGHITKMIGDLALTVLPMTAAHALRLFGLHAQHADPFDRILIATALEEDVPVVSCDREFKKYRGLRVIW